MTVPTPVTLLLVDDDDVDIEAIQRSFRKRKIGNPFVVAHDGREALALLRSGVPTPHIILLDLKMPGMGGIEFLKELRADEALTKSIVFVLTTSDADIDRCAAYKQHIAGYLLKSDAGTDFRNVIEVLEPYWCYVAFPPENSSVCQ
ncbi:MAG: response regulator [Lewinella sp.]|nr:response regulator [Lewinella sp.]